MSGGLQVTAALWGIFLQNARPECRLTHLQGEWDVMHEGLPRGAALNH